MKVLVIGAGGKEHALVWKLSQSTHINKIYCSPGNAGIAEIAECIDISPYNFSAIIDFVKYEWIDLTIVGPEKLLSRGIVNAFEKEGCKILGPTRTAVQIRSSRVFAKNLMKLYRIPTAEYKVFTSHLHAQDYVRLKGAPIIIKTDRYSEDNGVFIAYTIEEAIDTLKLIMKDRIFGDIGKQVLIEENLKGERVSFVSLTDGKTIIPFTNLYCYRHMSSGGSTGTGAFSPVPVLTKELEAIIMEKIMRPLLKALNSEGMTYKGILSADLIVNKDKAYLFDIKCYFEDLEAQTILPRLKTDLMDIVLALMEERLYDTAIEWKRESAVCIAIFLEDFSGKYQKDIVIKGLEKIKTTKDIVLFQENTSFDNRDIIASGSRVISITATGADLRDARTKAYYAAEQIYFEEMHYRKDIGD